MVLFWDPSMRILIDSSASTIQAYFELCSRPAQLVSLCWWRWSLQSIIAGIGIANFLRAFFIIRLKTSSSRSIKKIPRNLLTCSRSSLSIAHFCFFAFRCVRHLFTHFCRYSVRPWIFCFLVSFVQDLVFPSGGFSLKKVNHVKPVNASDNSLSPSTFQIFNMFLQHHIWNCDCGPGDVNVFQWRKEWFFSRHVQFDLGFPVMTVNEISWDRPEIIFGFTIIPRRVLKWSWRRPVRFSSKIILFFSLVWAVPD